MSHDEDDGLAPICTFCGGEGTIGAFGNDQTTIEFQCPLCQGTGHCEDRDDRQAHG